MIISVRSLTCCVKFVMPPHSGTANPTTTGETVIGLIDIFQSKPYTFRSLVDAYQPNTARNTVIVQQSWVTASMLALRESTPLEMTGPAQGKNVEVFKYSILESVGFKKEDYILEAGDILCLCIFISLI